MDTHLAWSSLDTQREVKWSSLGRELAPRGWVSARRGSDEGTLVGKIHTTGLPGKEGKTGVGWGDLGVPGGEPDL